ncbi:hypothetical protein CDAR_208751 [Caerostris darwini]|uniref:Secreted protein n=1 Tax=Caerostris darwini TaxID=1538125 RepID=A0AAV4VQ74_9ARAC|nr:hypothetical protein CDAR_208751 [Caerostris darwini]
MCAYIYIWALFSSATYNRPSSGRAAASFNTCKELIGGRFRLFAVEDFNNYCAIHHPCSQGRDRDSCAPLASLSMQTAAAISERNMRASWEMLMGYSAG